MKRLVLLLSCSGALMCAAELSGVRAVYFLPMSHGLDQYLANRLAGEHVFRVVTDPKLADAVFSDRLGESFQAQLDALLPPPPAPEQPKAKEKTEQPSTLLTETANKLSNPALASTFGRAKGTVFLVDKGSRQVLWSVYQAPKNSSSREMDRTASDIVSRLKKDLNRTEAKKAAPPEAAAAPAPPQAAPAKAAPQAAPAPAPAPPAKK